MRLAVVDVARGADQRSQVGGGFHQEPRVDADAVPAHARTGAEDAHARVQVGQADGFGNVHAKAVGQARELVGDGDIDVAVGVLHQLDHLGGSGVGEDDLAAHEGGVQVAAGFGAGRGDAADHARVFDQFAQDLAGQHAFGGVDHVKIDAGFQAGALEDGQQQVDRGARRRSRFEHHQVAGLQHGHNRLGGGDHRAHVGAFVVIKGRRHGDEKSVRPLGLGADFQVAGFARGLHQCAQTGLVDVHFTVLQAGYDLLVDIHADDAHPVRGEGARSGQSNVSQAEDTNFFKIHGSLLMSAGIRTRQLCHS